MVEHRWEVERGGSSKLTAPRSGKVRPTEMAAVYESLQKLLAFTPVVPEALAGAFTADCALDWFGAKSTGAAAVATWATDGNIDLALVAKAVDGATETGTFGHAHVDLRSQTKAGTYTATWADGQIATLALVYNA